MMAKNFFLKFPQRHCLIRILLSFFTLIIPSLSECLQVNNLSYLEKLTPGSKKQVKLTLINDRDVAEQIEFKLADYSCNSQGQHIFDEQTFDDISIKHPRSSINWIQLGQNKIILEPDETRDIYYTIEVPSKETLKGSYWCVLLIEPGEIASPNERLDEGFHLLVKIRYAHHIVINIGEGTPKLKILKKEIKEIEEKRYLCIHTLNEGELFFNPTLTLKLYDKEGKLEKTLQAPSERLYPNNSQCFFLDLQDISQHRLTEKLTGFLLFDGKDNTFFGDKFIYP